MVSYLANVEKLLCVIRSGGNAHSVETLFIHTHQGRRYELTRDLVGGIAAVLTMRCPVLNQSTYVCKYVLISLEFILWIHSTIFIPPAHQRDGVNVRRRHYFSR